VAPPPRRELDDALDQRSSEDARRNAVTEALDAGEQRVHLIAAQVDLEQTRARSTTASTRLAPPSSRSRLQPPAPPAHSP
jgi:hypothetical protein